MRGGYRVRRCMWLGLKDAGSIFFRCIACVRKGGVPESTSCSRNFGKFRAFLPLCMLFLFGIKVIYGKEHTHVPDPCGNL